MTDSPIPMRLPCPGTVPDGHGGEKVCGVLHIDEGIWVTKLHHTHSCQACGMTWRPAVVHTVGVRFLPGFKNDPDPVTHIKFMTGTIGLIEPGQQWQHLKIDTEILTVKGVGTYVTGQPNVTFTNGTILPEQTLRSGYRIYTPLVPLAPEIQPNDIVVRCVFDGEPCAITLDPRDTLSELCRRLCLRTNRIKRPVSDWEIRNEDGTRLPPDSKIQEVLKLQGYANRPLHISLPIGYGG